MEEPAPRIDDDGPRMEDDHPRSARVYRHHHLDSTRWDVVRFRAGDIVVSTSVKTGTTWTQRILSLLVFGVDPLPDRLTRLSPWVDSRTGDPLPEVAARLEAQEHRRFLKSHLPLDALPWDERVRYVMVGRDSRDVFMSLCHHYRAYTDLMYEDLAAGDPPGGPFPRWPGDVRWLWSQWLTRGAFPWESDGWPFWSHHYHAASFWAQRHRENILLVHYNDLLADLGGEMRRIAAHVGLDPPAGVPWPSLVRAATFESMKGAAEELLGPLEHFAGGAPTFFHQGTNGRWRGVLTEVDLALYDKVAASLDPGLRAWLEGGRFVAGDPRGTLRAGAGG